MKPVVGAQLYTLRNHCKTIPDIKDTFRRVKAIGYTAVQISGFGPVDPRELAAEIKNSGLTVGATHVAWSRFQNDLEAVIAEHVMWGCKHLAIGGLPGDYLSLAGLKKFIEEEKPIGERLAKQGMDFSYHNHSNELSRHGNGTWLGQLYASADPRLLKAELDVYWVQTGGGDPAEWIRKCAGREPLLHLKDMAVMPDRSQRMAEVGSGNLNWPAILKAAEDGGVEYLLVEQDDCYGRDPFECLAESYAFLKRMGYT